MMYINRTPRETPSPRTGTSERWGPETRGRFYLAKSRQMKVLADKASDPTVRLQLIELSWGYELLAHRANDATAA